MTLPNRTSLRTEVLADLKALAVGSTTPLANEGDGTEHAFKFLQKDPGGVSPFACIDSGNVQYSTTGSDTLQTPMVLMIGFWTLRGDADEHDVMLDNLALALALMLRDKHSASFPTPSVSDFEELGGVSYKFELHFVEFKV